MKNVTIFESELGYALTELIIVVTILGIIAVIAVPGFSSSSEKQIELAAIEIADAMRFARSESIRTGEPYGFRQESSAKRIRVFRLDQGTNPATLIYDVYHPVDKQIYDVDLNQSSFAGAESLNRVAVFRGVCNQDENIHFDRNGAPWCADPVTALVESFTVSLTQGTAIRVVVLNGITGRVTVK